MYGAIGNGISGCNVLCDTGIGASGCTADGHPPQVQCQCEDLHCALNDLHTLMGQLGERLQPVSRGCCTGETLKGTPEEVLVPVADAIRDFRKRVCAANDIVRDIIGRLEV